MLYFGLRNANERTGKGELFLFHVPLCLRFSSGLIKGKDKKPRNIYTHVQTSTFHKHDRGIQKTWVYRRSLLSGDFLLEFDVSVLWSRCDSTSINESKPPKFWKLFPQPTPNTLHSLRGASWRLEKVKDWKWNPIRNSFNWRVHVLEFC